MENPSFSWRQLEKVALLLQIMAYRLPNGRPQPCEYLLLLMKINPTNLEKFGDAAHQCAIVAKIPRRGRQQSRRRLHPSLLLTAAMMPLLLGLENCLSPRSSSHSHTAAVKNRFFLPRYLVGFHSRKHRARGSQQCLTQAGDSHANVPAQGNLAAGWQKCMYFAPRPAPRRSKAQILKLVERKWKNLPVETAERI